MKINERKKKEKKKKKKRKKERKKIQERMKINERKRKRKKRKEKIKKERKSKNRWKSMNVQKKERKEEKRKKEKEFWSWWLLHPQQRTQKPSRMDFVVYGFFFSVLANRDCNSSLLASTLSISSKPPIFHTSHSTQIPPSHPKYPLTPKPPTPLRVLWHTWHIDSGSCLTISHRYVIKRFWRMRSNLGISSSSVTRHLSSMTTIDWFVCSL